MQESISNVSHAFKDFGNEIARWKRILEKQEESEICMFLLFFLGFSTDITLLVDSEFGYSLNTLYTSKKVLHFLY